MGHFKMVKHVNVRPRDVSSMEFKPAAQKSSGCQVVFVQHRPYFGRITSQHTNVDVVIPRDELAAVPFDT
jgi:hypothetical protein